MGLISRFKEEWAKVVRSEAEKTIVEEEIPDEIKNQLAELGLSGSSKIEDESCNWEATSTKRRTSQLAREYAAEVSEKKAETIAQTKGKKGKLNKGLGEKVD